MGELTTDEYALIKAYFPRYGFNGGHDLSDIRIHFARSQSSVPVDRVLQALIAKRVLDASPDGRSVKFTDYGFELVGAMTNAQDEWDKQKIIRISNLERGQIPIRAGETFKANRVLREIFAQVRDQVAIVDLYVGTMGIRSARRLRTWWEALSPAHRDGAQCGASRLPRLPKPVWRRNRDGRREVGGTPRSLHPVGRRPRVPRGTLAQGSRPKGWPAGSPRGARSAVGPVRGTLGRGNAGGIGRVGTILGTMDKVHCSVYRKSSRGVSSARESAGIALQRPRVRIPYPPPFQTPLPGRRFFIVTGGSGPRPGPPVTVSQRARRCQKCPPILGDVAKTEQRHATARIQRRGLGVS